MMQKMLAQRFRLAVHKESRILQVYAMSVEKGGIKLHEATPGVEHTDPVVGSYSGGKTTMSGSKITMAVLAQYLTTGGRRILRHGQHRADRGLRRYTEFSNSHCVASGAERWAGIAARQAQSARGNADSGPCREAHPRSRGKRRFRAMKRSNKAHVAPALTLAAAAIAQVPPPSAPAVIETARKAALAFADSLPDFIVTRTTTRYRGARNPALGRQPR